MAFVAVVMGWMHQPEVATASTQGFVTKDWADSQNSYYCTILALRTGKRWLIELIKKLWATAWDQWEHRNAVLHEGDNLVQLEELNQLNANITQAYHEYKLFLPSTDQHFFAIH